MTAISHHIDHKGGRKTVCTATVLAHFGIAPDAYHYSGTMPHMKRVLSRHGFSVRSRLSRLPKGSTVGAWRKAIEQLDESDAFYLLRVPNHVILADANGRTIVDTDPRIRDRRKVTHAYIIRSAKGLRS